MRSEKKTKTSNEKQEEPEVPQEPKEPEEPKKIEEPLKSEEIEEPHQKTLPEPTTPASNPGPSPITDINAGESPNQKEVI